MDTSNNTSAMGACMALSWGLEGEGSGAVACGLSAWGSRRSEGKHRMNTRAGAAGAFADAHAQDKGRTCH